MSLENGPLVIPIDQVRQMIADCYWWRRIVALEHTHEDALPLPSGQEAYTKAELQQLRPFVIVQDLDYTEEATSVGGCIRPRGEVLATFRLDVPSEFVTDDSGLGRYGRKTIGRILRTGNVDEPGLRELSCNENRLCIYKVQVMPYERVDEKYVAEMGDFVLIDVSIHWGPR